MKSDTASEAVCKVRKHTSGLWRVSERLRQGTKSLVECEAGYAVAEAFSSPSVKIKYKDLWAEAEANAVLIAAAPELLESLELLTKMLAEWHDDLPQHVGDKEPAALAKARAVIAKATGENRSQLEVTR